MVTEWTVYQGATVHGWLVTKVYGGDFRTPCSLSDVWVTESQHGWKVQVCPTEPALTNFEATRMSRYERSRTYTRTESNVVKVAS